MGDLIGLKLSTAVNLKGFKPYCNENVSIVYNTNMIQVCTIRCTLDGAPVGIVIFYK